MGGNQSHHNTDAPSHDVGTIPVGVPVAKSAEAKVEAVASSSALSTKKLDLVFTMDCTGSMGSYISAAKAGITRITERLQQAEGYDLRFGLVAYRDHPPQDMTYVTKWFSFTNSLEVMQQHLGTLSAQGGGDGPEAVAAALKTTYDANWREDAAKVVVLIADAPPHGLGERGDGFPNGGPDGVDPLTVLDDMSARGMTIYSVGCQPALSQYRFATEFFIACAQRTNGQAVALGSAANLADVILGASIEEMDLEALTHEVQTMSQELRSAAPTISDEAVEREVWRGLQAKGVRTRQVGGSRLHSAHASLVSAAPSLAVAKASLAPLAAAKDAAAESTPAPRGGTKSVKKKTATLLRRSSSPSSPLDRVIGGRRTCVASMEVGGPVTSDLASDMLELEERMDELHCCEEEATTMRSMMPPMAMRAAPASSAERVELEEDVISMAQVSRMYGRGKAKGLW